jgi:nucleotide-binding universal stress UspA family protein
MYQKILVPLDGSELAECVLSHGGAMTGGAKVKKKGGEKDDARGSADDRAPAD